ncbi:MAG: hypothetical protein KC476_08625 [Cyanobacteria bacterium HKST-UBA06]|nr:hypothetical protein [Cyanobacteria bacterium HKST-UBA06]
MVRCQVRCQPLCQVFRQVLPVTVALCLAVGIFVAVPSVCVRAETPDSGSSANVTPSSDGAKTVLVDENGVFSGQIQEDVLNMTDNITLAHEQLKEHPNNAEAHFLYAVALSRSPYLEEAYNEMRQIRSLLKQSRDFGLMDRTIEQYEGLLKNHPNHDVAIYRLAFANYFKGYWIDKEPEDAKLFEHGPSSEYYAKAKTYMREVVSLKPDDVWARNYLGHIVLEHDKDVNSAIAIWQESLSVNDKQNPGALLMLARAYTMQGDIQKALIYGAKGLQQKQLMGLSVPK